MAVFQETEQAGLPLSTHPHRHRHVKHLWQAMPRVLVVMLAASLALSLAVSTLSAPPASAEESESTDAAQEITLSIDDATPVVGGQTGYHISVKINNGSERPLEAGALSLLTNVRYTFTSRTDLNDWAQGAASLAVHDELGAVSTPAIEPGDSATVNIDVAAQDSRLVAITTWGPKPLLIQYEANAHDDAQTQRVRTTIHSFLTRSTDGLNTVNTPAMDLTVAMPVTSDSWSSDDVAVDALLTDGTNSTGDQDEVSDRLDELGISNAVTPGEDENARMTALATLIEKYPQLQMVADPVLLAGVKQPPHVTGIMQPAGFDITQYAAISDPQVYESAGVSTSDWNTQRALDITPSSTDTDDMAIYAWQGSGTWSLEALTSAREQGYTTVIADQHFDETDTSTVHTGKYEISTDAGEITVLAAQRELSTLAQGQATDDRANAEDSEAGRLSRFMAQSAFYQMEQPYVSRNLMVLLDSSTSHDNADALMNALEQASWLNLTSLTDLNAAATSTHGEAFEPLTNAEAQQAATDDESGDGQTGMSVRTALDSLAQDRVNLTRVQSSILASNTDTDENEDPSPSDDESSQHDDIQQWNDALKLLQSTLSLHALGMSDTVRSNVVNASRNLTNQLLGGVSIDPSQKVTVVSETASMPITVRNSLPFDVDVTVSSVTDSMRIVTSPSAQVRVPAHGEAQATFTIRVATSSSAVATLTLQDREGNAFSKPEHTPITSSLQISDKSGLLIIALAVVLAIIGFYRQFNRVKDSDE